MKDLIERLEQAVEGSRELDAAIWNALYPEAQVAKLPDGHFPVSTSVDEAMTLVMSGYFMLRGQYNKKAHPGWIAETNNQSGYLSVLAQGQTAALALCIAALKARRED
jgi:hypothetical protein